MDASKSTMYTLVREGSMWYVKTKSQGIVQFKNTRKTWCQEWIINNDPELSKLNEAAAA
jgi:hypothetical protein